MKINVMELIHELKAEFETIEIESAKDDNEEKSDYYFGIFEAFDDEIQTLYHINNKEIEWNDLTEDVVYSNKDMQIGYNDGVKIINTIARHMAI